MSKQYQNGELHYHTFHVSVFVVRGICDDMLPAVGLQYFKHALHTNVFQAQLLCHKGAVKPATVRGIILE